MNHTRKFVLALLLALLFQHLAYSEEFKKHNFKIGSAKAAFPGFLEVYHMDVSGDKIGSTTQGWHRVATKIECMFCVRGKLLENLKIHIHQDFLLQSLDLNISNRLTTTR